MNFNSSVGEKSSSQNPINKGTPRGGWKSKIVPLEVPLHLKQEVVADDLSHLGGRHFRVVNADVPDRDVLDQRRRATADRLLPFPVRHQELALLHQLLDGVAKGPKLALGLKEGVEQCWEKSSTGL